MDFGKLALATAMAFGASQANAAVIYGDIGTTLTEDGSFQESVFDVNGDGFDDFSAGFFSSGAAFISGQTDFDVASVVNVSAGPTFGSSVETTVSQTLLIADQSGDAIVFADGDLVESTGRTDRSAYLYGNTNSFNGPNLMPSVGDSGYFGLEIKVGEGSVGTDDGTYFRNFTGETTTTYAFVNVEHGSIILSTTGYNTTAGAGALIGTPTIAPVPLPASALLLGAGLLGLGAYGRRKA